jgi:hypothetical protein
MPYGIDRHAISPAVREPKVLGFIEITERRRSGNENYRRPNLFRLTYRHCGDDGLITNAATARCRIFSTPSRALTA